jgi:hypothetical protein
MRRRRRCRQKNGTVIAISFGIGIFVAMCCSVKLILLLAAILVVYIGITCS